MMDRYALYVIRSTLLQLTVLNIRNRARDRSSDSFFERVKALPLSTAEYQGLNREPQKITMHRNVIYYLNELCPLHTLFVRNDLFSDKEINCFHAYYSTIISRRNIRSRQFIKY